MYRLENPGSSPPPSEATDISSLLTLFRLQMLSQLHKAELTPHENAIRIHEDLIATNLLPVAVIPDGTHGKVIQDPEHVCLVLTTFINDGSTSTSDAKDAGELLSAIHKGMIKEEDLSAAAKLHRGAGVLGYLFIYIYKGQDAG